LQSFYQNDECRPPTIQDTLFAKQTLKDLRLSAEREPEGIIMVNRRDPSPTNEKCP